MGKKSTKNKRWARWDFFEKGRIVKSIGIAILYYIILPFLPILPNIIYRIEKQKTKK